MSFILDGLETESYDRTYTDGELIRRIAGYFRPFRGAIALVALVLALNSIFDAIAPVVISRAVDMVAARDTYGYIALMSLLVLAVGAAAWVFNFIRQEVANRVIGDVVLQLRRDVFRHAVHHDMSFFDEHPVGRIVSRVTSDTQDFSNTVALVIDFLSEVLIVLMLTTYLMTVNWRLTLLLLAMAPVAALIALSFRKLARRVTLNAKRATSTINSHMQESIGGIAVAKAYRQEQRLYDDFETNNDMAYRVGLKRGLVLNLIFPLVGIAAGVGTGAVAFLGGLGVTTASGVVGAGSGALFAGSAAGGGMTPGEWYLFLQAVGFFWWPMLGIASFYSQFQDGLSAAERVFALIDAEPSVGQTDSVAMVRARGASHIAGALDFRDVTFAYSEKERVLDRFSLEIPSGQTLAIVGHTGAGKSTVARLITRFYEFQSGVITVDGRDIRSLDLASYRRQIGLVPQTPFLFTGTVRDNIRYALPEATDEDVRWAASHVGRGDWLDDLPDGLDTDVGERGGSISMGQRQLVALARVLLKNPAIFILDEATASVDPFTEAQIQEGLDSVMKKRTAVVIAHRLSTVKSADRIIVLDRGRIIEDGSHDQLLAASGNYAELYDTYFRHQSLEYIEGAVG